MPAGNLSSDWVCIATSGATADGREIKKEWLTSMAESYDPEFYSAKIWLDHYRFYGSQGEVLELKTEKATNEKLKGEIALFARMAPTAVLVELNRSGQYHHVSIEPIEDFGGKGFTYLGGIGITDYPASLGTSNVHFNGGEKTSKNYMGCQKIDLSQSIEAGEENKFFSMWKKFLKSETNKQGEAMDDKQFNQFLDEQKKQNEAFASGLTAAIATALADAFKSKEQTKPADDGKTTAADTPATVTAEQFTAQQKEITDIKNSVEEFGKKLDEALKQKVPGTQTDNNGGAQPRVL